MVIPAFSCLQFPSWPFLCATEECYWGIVSLPALFLILGGEANALILVLNSVWDWRSLAKDNDAECISERSPEYLGRSVWPWKDLWLRQLWSCLLSVPHSLKTFFWLLAGKKWSGENGQMIGLFTSSLPMFTAPPKKPWHLSITLSVRGSLAPWKVSLPNTWGLLPCSLLARGWRKGWYH